MYNKVVLSIFLYNTIAVTEAASAGKNVNEVADGLVRTLIDKTDVKRIKNLEEKLLTIDQFVIDKHKYGELLKNETAETNLTKINFFKSLTEDDHYRFLTNKEPKSLYLKLKEKITRDDVMSILADGNSTNITQSGRRMLTHRGDGNEKLERAVDELLGGKLQDDHKFDFKDDDGPFWDPTAELKDLNDYHRHDGRRLFRGERTTVRDYPFMASIHVMSRFWCGGAVYWHDLVLTSAACLQLFFRENPRVLQVRIGSNHSRIGGEMVDALEVYFHPGYNPKSLSNNIAVIRLRRHLYFNYHRIPKVISISHDADLLPSTSEVLLLGWGVTRSSQKLSFEPIYLQRKFLPVYPNKFCKEIYGDKFITTKMFCAGTMTTGEGACDHDAGGPAVLAGKLVGIISFGPTICGFPNAPTVFTLIGAFSDWIESVNESMPEYYRGKSRSSTSTHYPLTWNTEHSPPTEMVAPLFAEATTVPTETDRADLRVRVSDSDGDLSV